MSMSIREQYNIPEEAKVLLYVGNISHNKNQIQAARAYCLLPDVLREKVHILFCGRFNEDDEVAQYVITNNLEDHLHLCGIIPRCEIQHYYQESNATMLLSHSEGFGLSIIEGYAHGIPGLMFSDMDAVADLFDEACLLVVKNRTDDALANGMEELVSRHWNSKLILNKSKSFSSKEMAGKYIHIYNSIIKDRK